MKDLRKLDATALLAERDRTARNHRDPYQRARLAKIDRLLAAQGLLVA